MYVQGMYLNSHKITALTLLSLYLCKEANAIWNDAQSNGIQLKTDTLSWDQVFVLMLSWGALILVWVTGGLPLHFDIPLKGIISDVEE